MKKKFKKRTYYIINIFLIFLIFMFVSTAQAQVSAERTIEKTTLTSGSEINVTVLIKNSNSDPVAVLDESIPAGWILTRISDDADGFKEDAGEWAWAPEPGNNTDKNVKYKIKIPESASSGTYMINGNILTVLNTTSKVAGDEAITVTDDGSDGSSGSSGSGSSTSDTTAGTPEKNEEIIVTGSPTETVTVQPTETMVEQTTSIPDETDVGTPEATTTEEAPGFGVIISIGIIAAIYISRRMK